MVYITPRSFLTTALACTLLHMLHIFPIASGAPLPSAGGSSSNKNSAPAGDTPSEQQSWQPIMFHKPSGGRAHREYAYNPRPEMNLIANNNAKPYRPRTQRRASSTPVYPTAMSDGMINFRLGDNLLLSTPFEQASASPRPNGGALPQDQHGTTSTIATSEGVKDSHRRSAFTRVAKRRMLSLDSRGSAQAGPFGVGPSSAPAERQQVEKMSLGHIIDSAAPEKRK